jgi:hypothetical protein
MHKVPIHLDMQDKFLWNLTFRQVLILFVGGGITYLIVTTDWSTPLAALLCLLAGVLGLVATLLVAFVQLAHRSLDQWLIVAFLFYSSPRVFCWSALEEEQDTYKKQEKRSIPEKGEEEW